MDFQVEHEKGIGAIQGQTDERCRHRDLLDRIRGQKWILLAVASHRPRLVATEPHGRLWVHTRLCAPRSRRCPFHTLQGEELFLRDQNEHQEGKATPRIEEDEVNVSQY